MARLLLTMPLLAALSAACAEPSIGSRSDALEQTNGTWLNGTWLNGTWLNGTWLNGTWLNGTWLNGTTLGNLAVTDVHVEGSQLVGTQYDRTIAGDDFRNAQLTGLDANGNVVTLK